MSSPIILFETKLEAFDVRLSRADAAERIGPTLLLFQNVRMTQQEDDDSRRWLASSFGFGFSLVIGYGLCLEV